MEKVLSSHVGLKINEWYYHIQRFNVPDAEAYKEEIKSMLDHMEENQDLLLYFSLMEFRHKLMLDYLNPLENGKERANFKELAMKIKRDQEKLTGLLEYYFNFFYGMYEFENYEYLNAITFYKRAEKKLSLVSDDIERAEFNYKMAEIYYHMKQTHMSMHHIAQAIECYREKETYTVREIQCSFVIGLNYIDMGCPEKAIPHFQHALEKAADNSTKRLKGSALYNLGLSYFHNNNLSMAIKYFNESIHSFKEQGYEHLNKILDPLVMLTKSYFKDNQSDLGLYALNYGIELAEKLKDDIFINTFIMLKSLYIDNNVNRITESMAYLESKSFFANLEDLAKDAAKHYNKAGDLERSNEFYEKILYFQHQIKRGDCLYEI
ncbi:aspartate phosphatase response regulator [Bacillus safensis FO-36b]|uniref:Rap family tetratricopeptide repeat protein n=1 Tax=Bacillus TaxID=1386 RepID=UPI00045D0EE1|nr:Rap family tetratricopeptide repeat protein [Bacillus safensis]AWI36296.1 aspartate phosphatase [Bacillus safensis FO-36b]KDE25578.1 aspartate phosphatase response regulator [Bacillus safensis FO-36b]MBQ4841422.1 tetratricopeptide repeat protein [Bacillus safensis]MBQ4871113.1 tetratricopeptide repeat protein [Bacillus safensis]MBQ4885126.1 tetratricopeptide repeat protein [Bacillus safensis]